MFIDIDSLMKKKTLYISDDVKKKPFSLLSLLFRKIYFQYINSLLYKLTILILLIIYLLGRNFSNNFLIDSSITIFMFLILVPLAIIMEEFFHICTCISLSYEKNIKGIVIGSIYKKNLLIIPLAVCVEYEGSFNSIDKIYISSGGPLNAFFVLISISLILSALRIYTNIVFILISLIPLASFIPSKFLINTDGYYVNACRNQLNMNFAQTLSKILKTVPISLKFILFKRKYGTGYIDINSYYEKIDAVLNNNNEEEAIKLYNLCRLKEPTNVLILNNLAYLYMITNNIKKSYSLIKKLMRICPEDPDVKDTFNEIQSRMKK